MGDREAISGLVQSRIARVDSKGESMGNGGELNLIGPGWRAALEILGEGGAGIARTWSSPDGGEMGEEVWPEFGEELRPGARWRRYGRCGVACRLLRLAGRQARRRSA